MEGNGNGLIHGTMLVSCLREAGEGGSLDSHSPA